jgi:pimeloyl-[acyl-carrier protein] methyl ester esterase
MKLLTLHGWAFCPAVFKTLEGIYETEHLTLNGNFIKEIAQSVAEKIAPDTVLVGWSLGATISVIASTLKPPKGLVLIGATPNFGKAWKKEFLERFLKELEENPLRKIEEFRKTVWGEDVCGDYLLQVDNLKRLLGEFFETDISDRIRELKVPALLLHGKKDPITPFREAKKMLKLNPRLRLIAYDGGHFPKNFTRRDWEKVFESLFEL